MQYPLRVLSFPVGFRYKNRFPVSIEDWAEQNFTLTFWLQSSRWDMIKKINTYYDINGFRYIWKDVIPQKASIAHEWRRVVLPSSRAEMEITEAGEMDQYEFKLELVTPIISTYPQGYIAIDEIRLSIPK